MDISWQVEGSLYKKVGMDLYGEAKYEFAAPVKMGVVSFMDVAKAVLEEQSFENKMLKSYIKNWPSEAPSA